MTAKKLEQIDHLIDKLEELFNDDWPDTQLLYVQAEELRENIHYQAEEEETDE